MVKKIFVSCLVIGMLSAGMLYAKKPDSAGALGKPVGSFNRDSNQIFTAHSKNGNLWDLYGNLIELKGHRGNINCVDFSPNGSLVATGSDDKTVKLWDTGDGSVYKTLSSSRSVGCVVFSPDGTLVAAGSADGKVKIWDVLSSAEVATLSTGTRKAVMSLRFHPTDSTYLAAGAFTNDAKLWHYNTVTTDWDETTLSGHTGPVVMIRFNTDGTKLITASKDATGRTWLVSTGNLICTYTHGSPVPSRLTSAIYTPDELLAFTAGKDSDIKVWNATLVSPCDTSPTILTGHGNIVEALNVSPDSEYLVSGSYDNTAKVWDLTTIPISLDKTLVGHTNAVGVVQYNNDGSLILTVAWDKTARVWNAVTGVSNLILNS